MAIDMTTAGKCREKDLKSVWHPYTRFSELKAGLPVIVRGRGPYLYDADGRRLLDAVSSWWACNLGHGNRRVIAAIRRQAGKLQHSILGNLTHPAAAELAGRIAGLMPGRKRRVMFASDGASAVEAALKMALQYWHNTGRPERNRFACLDHAYHGDTIGAMSVGYLESFHKPFAPVVFGALRAESPHCAACVHGRRPETCRLECLESMRGIFRKHGKRLAAVIIEPLCQGAGGMRMHPPKYLSALSGLCRRHGTLLIADEIAVGMGRTGRMFACDHASVDPDIMCIGKGLSAGYLPISAAVARESIYMTFGDAPADNTFYHGHTYCGNPIACAAALETLDIYRDSGIVKLAGSNGRILAGEMKSLESLPGVSAVRCLGMIAALDVPNPRAVRQRLLLDYGIMVRPLGKTVYLMLPLNTQPSVIRSTVRALGRCLCAKP